jgi:hypothetical protein
MNIPLNSNCDRSSRAKGSSVLAATLSRPFARCLVHSLLAKIGCFFPLADSLSFFSLLFLFYI